MTVTLDKPADEPGLFGPTVPWPNRLLTLADWDALSGDDRYRHAELDEGVLVLAPSPSGPHQRASWKLTAVLEAALPASLTALPAVDVELVDLPATVRQPDVLVLPEQVYQRTRSRYGSADLVLAVEIVSPGSGGRDAVLKRHQYGAAGVACYWVIDFDREPALTVCTDPQPAGGYATATEHARDEAVALRLPGVDEPVRFSVAELLRR